MASQPADNSTDVAAASSSWKIRLRGAAVAVACGGLLLVASRLTPEPAGYGTHEQLGLPACAFLAETRWPCPTCGLTTSLARAVRGQLTGAFWAHPFGIVVCAASVILGLAGTAELITGHKLITKLRIGPWWLVAAVVALLAGWGLKLLTGYLTGRLPAP